MIFTNQASYSVFLRSYSSSSKIVTFCPLGVPRLRERVCMLERERERECVCLCWRERECVWVWERVWMCMCECECMCVRARVCVRLTYISSSTIVAFCPLGVPKLKEKVCGCKWMNVCERECVGVHVWRIVRRQRLPSRVSPFMGWLQLVGSIKLYVSFAEYILLYRALLNV